MDNVKAQDLFQKLKDRSIADWQITDYVSHGKSAAVFKGRKGKEIAAVKVFDDELIKKYGDETQFARIERELTLVGKPHPNMVPIYGGGHDTQTDSHYIIMEFIDGPNLADCLTKIPEKNIGMLISQLASAARFLEDHELCHRDIKPENIAVIDDLGKFVLLDFGVLRPFGVTGLTDANDILPFIGTLQYSSPEFLLRKECQNGNLGWRALTFYQIGGVLHDLIMRKPLFSEFMHPYATLVNAVQFEQPKIQSSAVSQHLQELAGRCLLKDWKVRVGLVTWQQFEVAIENADTAGSAKQRVANRTALKQAQLAQVLCQTVAAPKPSQIISRTIDHMKISIRTIRAESTIFPPATITRVPASGSRIEIRFDPSLGAGLSAELRIFMDVSVLETISSAVQISGRAFYGAYNQDEKETDGETLYAGVSNGPGIRAALETYLYATVDVAQQRDPAEANEGWLTILMTEAK